ncbi:hypothetical protein J26TS2_06420 [Shouchella clausii]|nr:hypothetical protein J26TS2_06420 [Shouchella clausii]
MNDMMYYVTKKYSAPLMPVYLFKTDLKNAHTGKRHEVFADVIVLVYYLNRTLEQDWFPLIEQETGLILKFL